MNNTYKEFIENYIKQYFEDMQRVNQQWFNLFWRPYMGEQQQQPPQEQEKKQEEKG
jgi:hypothetical protein